MKAGVEDGVKSRLRRGAGRFLIGKIGEWGEERAAREPAEARKLGHGEFDGAGGKVETEGAERKGGRREGACLGGDEAEKPGR